MYKRQLLTSADHYGAVIHRQYDYAQSLREIARHGLNHTRLFAGAYREVPGDFGIQHNLLGPSDADYVSPYLRLEDGRYDLDTPNPEFFQRLSDYVRCASAVSYTHLDVYKRQGLFRSQKERENMKFALLL